MDLQHEDISVDLLAYDWRTGTDKRDTEHVATAPDRNLSAAPAKMQLPLGGVVYPPSSTGMSPSPAPFGYPATVPHRGAPLNQPLNSSVVGARNGAPVNATSSRKSTFLPGQPLEPITTQNTVGAQKDAAAMMLETLQSKLNSIQSQVKAIPKTGYAARPRSESVQNVPCLPKPDIRHEDDSIFDEDFVALVACQVPITGTKRKAEYQLDEAPRSMAMLPCPLVNQQKGLSGMPKADLKTRNRWSAKASRERKKAHLEKLHRQVDELTAHNLELASVCKELVEDNTALRKELEGMGCTEAALAKIIAEQGTRGAPINDPVPIMQALPTH